MPGSKFSVLVSTPKPTQTADGLRSAGFEIRDDGKVSGQVVAIIEAESDRAARSSAQRLVSKDCRVHRAQPFSDLPTD